jgi:UDP-N-acetylmuramoyl-tripeptide--D-alanyl-D-alanine ligase
MTGWTIPQLLEATQGQLVRGQAVGEAGRISIDSRSLAPGDAFVAIRGTRYDGHRFVEEAAHRGASSLIVSHLMTPTNGSASLPTILVDDTTEALADLARFRRRQMGRPVIAVTGSCGKTTTKELLAHLLGEPGTILKTQGTQNNHIGVPLTLLRMAAEHEQAVVELGTNHPGEIAYLASIVEPTAAVITNVGPSHLEFFGSLMEVLHEKLSLLEALPSDGCAVLPGDQLDVCLEAQHYLASGVRIVTFGTTDRCDIQAVDIQRDDEGMTVRLRDQVDQWTIPLVGYHNVENALAAIAGAWAMGLPLSVAKQRVACFAPIPLRSQILRCNGLTILNDCYNANPLSFARALEMLRDLSVRRKVAIVGDMLELGEFAPAAHQAIGRLAAQLGIDTVIAVGGYADHVAQGVREGRPGTIPTYRTVPELLAHLPAMLQEGDGLLVKGSRKLNLEQVTEFLLQHYRGAHVAHHR